MLLYNRAFYVMTSVFFVVAACTPRTLDTKGAETMPPKPLQYKQPSMMDKEHAADPVVPGEVIVEFRAGTTPERIETILAATNTRIKSNLGRPLVYLLTITGSGTTDDAICQLTKIPDVLHAEPNRIVKTNSLSIP